MQYMRKFFGITLIIIAVALPVAHGGVTKGKLVSNSTGSTQKAGASLRAEDNEDVPTQSRILPQVNEPIDTYREEQEELSKQEPTHNIPLTMPNGPVDVSGFSGTIHVGSVQAFTTLSSVVGALNAGAPITADVTFLLDDASYSEPGFNLGPITYEPGGPYTVIFRPNTGASVTTTITGTTTGGYILTGASNVIFEGTALGGTPGGSCGDPAVRNWHIQLAGYPGSTSYGTIVIQDGCSFITVADCNIEGAIDGAVTAGTRVISMTNTAPNLPQTDITIQNCEIHTGRTGIYSSGLPLCCGYPTDVNNWDKRINVRGNDVYDIKQTGIFLQQLTQSNVYCNKVHDVIYPTTFPSSSTRMAGIRLNNNSYCNIDKNTIDNIRNLRTSETSSVNGRVYGIRANQFPVGFNPSYDGVVTGDRISNNCITRLLGASTTGGGFREIGIEDGGARQDSILHNTVYFTGDAGPNYDGSTCLQTFGQFTLLGHPFVTSAARCMAINNIFVNDRTSGGWEHTCIRPFNSGGVRDYRASSNNNVLYSPNPDGEIAPGYPTLLAWHNYNPPNDANSVSYDPLMLAANDCHWNTTGPSSASNLGSPNRVVDDLVGTVRSTIHPDAGAIEEATNAPLYHDAYVASIDNPTVAGLPIGVTFTGFAATAGNLTQNDEATVSVNFKVFDPSDVKVFEGNGNSGPLPGTGTVLVSVPGSWTPTTAGTHRIVAVVSLAGDIHSANDTIQFVLTVLGLKLPDYCTSFETAPELDGWFADGDFALGSNAGGNTKLGGAHSGDKCFVTVPGSYGDVYNAGVVSHLYSPYFDLSGTGSGYISFWQNIMTEPSWDRSVMEYSIDTGRTWQILGMLNDSYGINWYNTLVYHNANAPCENGDLCEIHCPPPFGWTSNGDCNGDDIPVAPVSCIGSQQYIFVQYALNGVPAAASPLGKKYVRFRYSTYADFTISYDGWSIDDFCFITKQIGFQGSVCGVKFNDANGNGVKDPGENTVPGTIVLSYFDIPIDTINTDNAGNYCFNNLIAGCYSVTSIKPSGVAITTTGTFTNDGSQALTVDIGNYEGSISGTKWNDLNENGQKDPGEPGLANWTIWLQKNYCDDSPPVATTTTDANGNYAFTTLPGTFYYVKEIQQSNWEKTFPPDNCIGPITISGASGGIGSSSVNNNFGNFQFATIRLENVVDRNGDGILQAEDLIDLPYDGSVVYEVRKNGFFLFRDSLTHDTPVIVHSGLDLGTYTVNKLYVTPGWVMTFGNSYTFNIATGGVLDTARSLIFQMPSACGKKFEDKNGNGTQDVGEPGLSGWKINISGTGYGSLSAVTDVNGDWCIDSLGGGAHVISEVLQNGWYQTKPAGGTYSFNGTSANVPGANQVGKDFGNFKTICISGVKYRDRNNNGTQDPGEEGLGGWTISVDGIIGNCVPASTGSAVTAGDGTWQICCVGPGNHVVSETAQLGFTQTEPVGGTYNLTASSGVDVTGLKFGNFKDNDASYLYRTFSSDDMIWAAQNKAAKKWSAKAPTVANLRNVVKDFFAKGQNLSVQVGVPGLDIKKGPPFVLVVKEGDFLKSLWDKGVEHGDIFRGFTTNNAGTKLLLGKQKSLSAKLHNNDDFEEALMLQFNLQLSNSGKTPAGLGNLIYNDGVDESSLSYCAGFPLNGKTVNDIMAQANTMLTNPSLYLEACYVRLEEVLANINDAFGCGGVDCELPVQPTYNQALWEAGGKMSWLGLYPVTAVPYLRANANAVPDVIIPTGNIVLPKEYAMYQNYPNPFNPTTSIDFDLPKTANVTLKIYNLLGQEVATLLNDEQIEAGSQTVDFDASALSSGVYVYRLVATGVDDDGNVTTQVFAQTKKMVLMK